MLFDPETKLGKKGMSWKIFWALKFDVIGPDFDIPLDQTHKWTPPLNFTSQMTRKHALHDTHATFLLAFFQT